jgi:FkbM family methyltransferase
MGGRLRVFLGDVYDRLPLKQPVMQLLRPLGLPEPLYRHLHFHGVITVPTPGRPIRMQHVAEEIENELFWEGLPGRRERVSMGLWMRLCITAHGIVDVGANSGVYALVARALNPTAPVLAFEPLPDLHARLVRNSELSGFGIDAPRVALSARQGMAAMSGWTIGAAGAETVEVPTARLDEIARTRGVDHVDLIKIDVEGHEPDVLTGMGEMLRRDRPTMLLEVLTEGAATAIRPLLDGLGYAYFDLDEVNPPRWIPRVQPSSKWNLLVCTRRVAEKLGLP